jgi:hypothetical protein
VSIPDSGERTSFSTGAVRDTAEGKPRPTLLPPMIYRMLAMRATEGAAKYDDHNWAKGMHLSRYTDAIQRHLWAFLENDDSEDHLGAIMWNAGALAWTQQQIRKGNLPAELDDLIDWSLPPVAPKLDYAPSVDLQDVLKGTAEKESVPPEWMHLFGVQK